MLELEPSGNVGQVVFEKEIGGGGSGIGLVIASSLGRCANTLVNVGLLGVTFNFGTGKGRGSFGFDAAEHKFP